VGRATVTNGRTPHSPAVVFQGACGDGPGCGCGGRFSKAELADNRVIHSVAPVVAPLAFAVFPCAGSCARSPHPSPASGAPGATAGSALRR